MGGGVRGLVGVVGEVVVGGEVVVRVSEIGGVGEGVGGVGVVDRAVGVGIMSVVVIFGRKHDRGWVPPSVVQHCLYFLSLKPPVEFQAALGSRFQKRTNCEQRNTINILVNT